MSFFGGGTDIKKFFLNFEGSVISTTFDKYCYVTVRHLPKFFNYSSEISYSKIERVGSTKEILHPAVRNAMEMLQISNIRLTYEADLPARSGLGTSSSFAVGMLNAFHALNGHYTSKKKLADEAIYLERELCGEDGGWQDQIAASYGGLNRINFNKDGSYDIKPIIMPSVRKKELNKNLFLFFTGFTRFSSDIQKDNLKYNNDKISYLLKILELVDYAEKILMDETIPLDEFGLLLDRTWKLKKNTGGEISTPQIDDFYDIGIRAGALGGKLLGAGGGGFLLFYVPPEKHASVKKALGSLLNIPFLFENGGSKIIYYDEN